MEMQEHYRTRMWANAHADGSPAEYRWRRKVWLTPTTTLPRSNAAKTRNPSKFAGVPQTRQNSSQPLVSRSSPYYEDMWRRYCSLTSFFPIVNTCLSCEYTAGQMLCDGAKMAIFWRFFASCIISSEPRAVHFRLAF